MAAALGTAGTTATTSLKAVQIGALAGINVTNYPTNYYQGIALLNALMRYPDAYYGYNAEYGDTGQEYNTALPVAAQNPGGAAGAGIAFQCPMINNNQLWFPDGRGMLQLYAGDIVAVETHSGWPIIISNYAANVGSTTWHFANNS